MEKDKPRLTSNSDRADKARMALVKPSLAGSLPLAQAIELFRKTLLGRAATVL
jgi:hypothetical protein